MTPAIAGLLILIGAASPDAGATNNPPPPIDAGTEGEWAQTPCDTVHPSHFTYIKEIETDSDPLELYRPELVLLDGGQPLCSRGKNVLEEPAVGHAGRWTLSERSELVLTFDPQLVQDAVSTLGRIDVSGMLITGTTSRPVEVPGYQEIGRAVPSSEASLSATEETVSNILAVLELSRVLSRVAPHSDTTMETAYGGKVREWYGSPLLDLLLTHADHYQQLFKNVLKHADAITLSHDDPFLQVLQVATLGLKLLDTRAAFADGLPDRIASIEAVIRSRALDRTGVLLPRPRADPKNDKEKLEVTECEKALLDCLALNDIRQAGTQTGIATVKAACSENRGVIALENIRPKLEKAQAERRSVLSKMKPADLAREVENLDRNQEEYLTEYREEVTQLEHLPVVTEFIHQAVLLNKAFREAGTNPYRSVRENLRKLAANNWREIRLQPKTMGAKEGDSLELTVTYYPPGSVNEKASAASQPASTASEPTDPPRPARWILRFIIERSGAYVDTSAKLSLVWTSDFSAGTAFHGAQGSLVPGVGLDFLWFGAHRYGPFGHFMNFVFAGFGIRVDYLDFDTVQSLELGIAAQVLLFRGIMAIGVGYNFAIPDPRWSPRSLYWSIGLGVDKVLDQAKKVVDLFSQ